MKDVNFHDRLFFTFYIGQAASKLWKRFCAEIETEINLLAENWKYILGGLIGQELGLDKAYISETIFTSIFLSFAAWTFHPFIVKNKKIYTVLIWCRILAFLVDSKLATLPRPDNALEVILINFRGVLYGCGDLIFSSHMIFSLVFMRTYHKYGTHWFVKQFVWLKVVIQSLLIVASRKHYTVDVVVAWYNVNLVVFFLDIKLPELPDRSNGSTLLLPLTKDNKPKEENHKLVNRGNFVDSSDWRPRTQINGKIMEEGIVFHVEAAIINGP